MEATLERREWLKDLRKEKGLTVRAIAPLLACSWTHYSDIENGRRNPSIDLAVRMAKFFGIDVTAIILERVKNR
jgi:putative transcriptional regulator